MVVQVHHLGEGVVGFAEVAVGEVRFEGASVGAEVDCASAGVGIATQMRLK